MTYPTVADAPIVRKAVTLHRLLDMHAKAEKIAMLTCYDASFAALLERSAVDSILVGDSLGMVLQGHGTTLPVTVEHIAYHVASVARGNKSAWLIADMPFGSYQESSEQAYRNAATLMQAGAQMIKMEGGGWLAPTIEFMVARGIPICAHLGFTPQSVHALGGYRVQGKTDDGAQALFVDAKSVEAAGAQMLVLEMVPASVAASITGQLHVPTIGIGAGKDCSGQVLVLHDMLGIYPKKTARFVRNFMESAASIEEAVGNYVKAVKDGSFPAPEHGF